MSQLSQEYQLFRKILCVCPCCNKLVRVSELELKLKAKGQAPRTWLDNYEKSVLAITKKEENFEEQEKKLREIAHAKGRAEAEKTINKAMCKPLKALRLDPFDVKPILSPIDFVVFNGMNKADSVNDILLLSRKHQCPSLEPIHKQIGQAVIKQRYDWQVARIEDDGSIVLSQPHRNG
ncbi:MAG: Holliday junction resolvase-like protein [Candidatus Bathyarchaeia archaeon]|jgi:predicted Holliday junction resolvase-like endonuclease